VSGNTYTATMSFPQFSEEGVWRDWLVSLCDKTGNCVDLDTYDLLHRGINAAVGVGVVQTAYSRTVGLRLRRRAAIGWVDSSTASSCWWYVPVMLQRRSVSGWKKIGQTVADFNGNFRFRTRGIPGRYKATAITFGVGTPTVTTCSAASKVARKR
jgi:hypothetical protein